MKQHDIVPVGEASRLEHMTAYAMEIPGGVIVFAPSKIGGAVFLPGYSVATQKISNRVEGCLVAPREDDDA